MKDDEIPALILIDPPVGPFDAPDAIRAWIRELEAMPQVPYVPDSLTQAREWLAMAETRAQSGDAASDCSDD